jgi:hypothetical protein
MNKLSENQTDLYDALRCEILALICHSISAQEGKDDGKRKYRFLT